MLFDRSSRKRRTGDTNRIILFKRMERGRPIRKRSLRHNIMKKILLLISIGLFAMFSAGCITEDAGTAGAKNQSMTPPPAREMPVNDTEGRVPLSEFVNGTRGPIKPGSMPPELQRNSTNIRPMPSENMNGTPVSMRPDSMSSRAAPPDRSDINQAGIPRPEITGS